MKILLIGYRYFVAAGSERYLFNVKSLLEAHGHEVIPFSNQYSRNEPTPYARYFAPPLAGPDEVFFHQHSWTPRSLLRTVSRAIYSPEVYRCLRALIRDTEPDFAIVLQYLKKLSPSVLAALHDAGVPFAVRISDYSLVCPNSHLVRKGQPCELCLTGSLWNSVYHRCTRGSVAASTVNFAAAAFRRWRRYNDLVPRFLVPSMFTMQKLELAGVPRGRMVHLPTFVPPTEIEPHLERKRQIAFVGRITSTKGVPLLLGALGMLQEEYGDLDFDVVLAGPFDPSDGPRIEEEIAASPVRRIRLTGALPKSEVLRLIAESRCTVSPSLWYDNMPNAVLESLSTGTPVIVPRHGSFPEVVSHGVSGLFFEPGDRRSLAQAIQRVMADDDLAESLSHGALKAAEEQFDPELHYNRLMEIIGSVVGQPGVSVAVEQAV